MKNGTSDLVPEGATDFTVSKLTQIEKGAMIDLFFFSLNYIKNGISAEKNLVLKSFHETDGNLMCLREFEVMTYLEQHGFPVPKVYFGEFDGKMLGNPFVIMNKEKAIHGGDFRDWICLGATLAKLHNYDICELKNTSLKPPEDSYKFAKIWLNHIRRSIDETKLENRLKKISDLSVTWLQRHLEDVSCPKYCLLHGDYNPENVLTNTRSRMMVLDWDWTEIGDPACDVGYTYHSLKFFCNPKNPLAAGGAAEQFVTAYTKNFNGDIGPNCDSCTNLLGF